MIDWTALRAGAVSLGLVVLLAGMLDRTRWADQRTERAAAELRLDRLAAFTERAREAGELGQPPAPLSEPGSGDIAPPVPSRGGVDPPTEGLLGLVAERAEVRGVEIVRIHSSPPGDRGHPPTEFGLTGSYHALLALLQDLAASSWPVRPEVRLLRVASDVAEETTLLDATVRLHLQEQ